MSHKRLPAVYTAGPFGPSEGFNSRSYSFVFSDNLDHWIKNPSIVKRNKFNEENKGHKTKRPRRRL